MTVGKAWDKMTPMDHERRIQKAKSEIIIVWDKSNFGKPCLLQTPVVPRLHSEPVNPQQLHGLQRTRPCIGSNVKDRDVKCLDDLAIPKLMCIGTIFPRQSHDEACRTWLHDILFTMDVICSVIHSKDCTFNSLIQTTDNPEIIVLVVSE